MSTAYIHIEHKGAKNILHLHYNHMEDPHHIAFAESARIMPIAIFSKPVLVGILGLLFLLMVGALVSGAYLLGGSLLMVFIWITDHFWLILLGALALAILARYLKKVIPAIKNRNPYDKVRLVYDRDLLERFSSKSSFPDLSLSVQEIEDFIIEDKRLDTVITGKQTAERTYELYVKTKTGKVLLADRLPELINARFIRDELRSAMHL